MQKLFLGHLFEQFQKQNPEAVCESYGATVLSFMEDTRRELALHVSDMMGAQSHVGQFGGNRGLNSLMRGNRGLFRDLIEDTTLPYLVIDPRPGLRIVDANQAYATATMTSRHQIAGEKLFDVFPDNPDIPNADGVSNLYESLQKAAQSGQAHAMAIQRYDVQGADGNFVERRWRPLNTPIFDDAGGLIYLLHHVVDVTGQ